jgi:hypothetical protein
MQRLVTLNQNISLTKGALKPNFALYKEFIGPPVIVPVTEGGSQYQVTQTSLVSKDGSFLPVANVNNEVSFLRGTSFTISVLVLDPDNQKNRTDISQLTFRWKKNDAYLTSVNNQNNFKGFNVITFTEEQATQEVSGIYTLEITNQSGTITTTPLIVNVYNRLNNPQLYRNLIKNESGLQEFNNWTVDGNVAINEFYPYSPSYGTNGSILIRRSLVKEAGSTDYYSVQPELPFKFSSDETARYGFLPLFKAYVSGGAAAFKSKANETTPINRPSIYPNQPPNLVPNENTGSAFGCFFPSREFMDEYNQNNNKVGLANESRPGRTYFTRSPISRQTSDTATLTQTIDINDLDNFADGLVCGVTKLVGHFFAYVGLGISNYEYLVKFKPESGLPSKRLNTLILTFDKLKLLFENGTLSDGDKIDLTKALEIHLIPKCNDTVDFTFRYVDAFGSYIGEDTATGPTVDDLFAVKEKVILPLILSRMFTRACKLPTEGIPVRYKGTGKLFDLREYTKMNDPMAIFLKDNFTTEYINNALQGDSVLQLDRGAAAFFGIQKKLFVPTGTRSIEVVVNMRHESISYGLSTKDSGINRYDIDEIQAEHVTPPLKLYRSGQPRIGVTQMKLCLYDNEYKQVAGYPSYYIPNTHIWSVRKGQVNNRIEGYSTTDTTIRYFDYTRDILTTISEEGAYKPDLAFSPLPREGI